MADKQRLHSRGTIDSETQQLFIDQVSVVLNINCEDAEKLEISQYDCCSSMIKLTARLWTSISKASEGETFNLHSKQTGSD